MLCNACPQGQFSPEKKDRCSNNTTCTENDFDSANQVPSGQNKPDVFFCPVDLFIPRVIQPQICPKVLIKAVSWLQMNAWTKGCDIETTLLSISYFYSYVARSTIHKEKLEVILCTCLFMACKMTRSPELSPHDILRIIGENTKASEIIEEESKLAEMLEWDLWLTFQVIEQGSSLLDSEEMSKILFLTQLLLLKSDEPLHDEDTIRKIKLSASQRILAQKTLNIKQLLKKNASKFLINKYKSKFDVDGFLEQQAI